MANSLNRILAKEKWSENKVKVLVTGSSGFIGFHLCKRLLMNSNNRVFGIDNMNSYYDIKLKKDRLQLLRPFKNFKFQKIDINNQQKLESFFKKNKFDYVIHLAAQAGVRHSIHYPKDYLDSNIYGFFNVLELSKKFKIKHLIFASTSSVYGSNKSFPSKESDAINAPLSFYAATKISNEAMAHSYSNIHNLPCTAVRFFTVYGPFGRPDMALFNFIDNIFNSKPIKLYNKGDHIRDFTYVDDVVESISRVIKKVPPKKIRYRILNIGCGKPKSLTQFLGVIEETIGIKARVKYLGMQKGDTHTTHASIRKLNNTTNFKPKVSIEVGIKRFVDWYKEYYKR